MPFSRNDLPTILALLGEMSGRREVDALFRRKGATFSAPNWELFLKKRVPSALDDGRVAVDDLADLLREAEEHGRQHVFLYKRAQRRAASEYLDENRIRLGLNRAGLPAILDNPRVLDKPNRPTFTEVRVDKTPNGQPKALVIKQIVTKESRQVLGETRTSANRIRIDVAVEEMRAVNVVKLHADGFCEIRLQSHKNPQYTREASQLLITLQELLPSGELQKFVLTAAKNNLFAQRKKLRADIRYTSSLLKDDYGSMIEASASTDVGDLFADDGMASTVDEFMKHDSYCSSSNFWIRVGTKPPKTGRDKPEPNWVHVLAAGQDNEFVLTGQCSLREYDGVLSILRENAR